MHQAPPLSLAMVISLELEVCDGSSPLFARLMAWSIGVCVWGCMRAADLQGIDMSRLRLSNNGLKGYLGQTKTTGPDKRVAEVPFHILRAAGISGQDWLKVGFELWIACGRLNRDYLLLAPPLNWEAVSGRPVKPEDVTLAVRRVFGRLRVPRRGRGGTTWELEQNSSLLSADLVIPNSRMLWFTISLCRG